MLYRQGDILVEKIESIPKHAIKQKMLIIASSDTTGHRHRIKVRRSASLYETSTEMYLEVLKDTAELVHPEHDSIVLERGFYRVWHQREYTETGHAKVMD